DLQHDVTVERRHLDRAAERRRREADRHLARQVLTVAREDRVRLHDDVDVEVTRRPAVTARLALARQPDAVAVVDACRHLDRKRPDLADDTRARAIGARLLDARTRAAADRARLLDREKALLHTHVAVAGARRARDALRAGRRPRAVARSARDPARNLDLDRVARDRLLERELELVAQVSAAVHLRPAARSDAENVAEHVAEDVAECVRAESVRAEAAACPDTRMAEPIVSRALAVVRQDLVGLLDLLELGLGLRIVRIAIRVILHRQAAVGLLQVLGARIAIHAEHFVVVALGHILDHPQSPRPRSAFAPSGRRRFSPKSAVRGPFDVAVSGNPPDSANGGKGVRTLFPLRPSAAGAGKAKGL